MALLADYGTSFSRLKTWQFWRTMIVFFCAFSFLGHVVEYPYVWIGCHFFNSVDAASEVLTNPFKPFLVYGFGIVACTIVLEPFRDRLLRRFPKTWQALLVFYICGVFLGMAGELIQGFLQNQPVDGVYPLWDVSDYPGNILGQAWIVNDLLLGALITVIVWLVVPACMHGLSKLTELHADRNCMIIIFLFIIIMIITYIFVPISLVE